MILLLALSCAALVAGLAAGWALRGPAQWCPACGYRLICRHCEP